MREFILTYSLMKTSLIAPKRMKEIEPKWKQRPVVVEPGGGSKL